MMGIGATNPESSWNVRVFNLALVLGFADVSRIWPQDTVNVHITFLDPPYLSKHS